MLDIHCHIIPEIDDGADSIKTSLNMAKIAYELGYNSIIATPHYIESAHETKKEDIITKIDMLNKMLKEKNIDINIYQGNEIYYSQDIINLLQEDKVCTLADSRYFLLELPFNGKVLGLKELIENVTHMGYIPIIAHPERYDFVNKNYKVLNELIKEGALLQINILSILGYYGKKPKNTVKKLLKKNMVAFIGTDSHDNIRVYEYFDLAKNKIMKIVGDKKWEQLTKINPSSIIEDKNIN